MTPSDGKGAPDPLAQLTWKDLNEYAAKQTQADRALIDDWFKRASLLLGIVLTAATVLITFGGIVIAFLGWTTYKDVHVIAKSVAESEARDAAKAKVTEILQDKEIQPLVRATAEELFRNGVFRQEIEKVIQAQLPVAVHAEFSRQLPAITEAELKRRDLLPRTISPQVEDKFRPKLRPYAGKKVVIYYPDQPEPKIFAESIEHSLNRLGLVAEKPVIWNLPVPQVPGQVFFEDEGLGAALIDMISEATGHKPEPLKKPLGEIVPLVKYYARIMGGPQIVHEANAYIRVTPKQAPIQ